MIKIENQDIIKWCKTYKGEPFHALLCDFTKVSRYATILVYETYKKTT